MCWRMCWTIRRTGGSSFFFLIPVFYIKGIILNIWKSIIDIRRCEVNQLFFSSNFIRLLFFFTFTTLILVFICFQLLASRMFFLYIFFLHSLDLLHMVGLWVKWKSHILIWLHVKNHLTRAAKDLLAIYLRFCSFNSFLLPVFSAITAVAVVETVKAKKKEREGECKQRSPASSHLPQALYILSPHPINVTSRPDNIVGIIEMKLIEMANSRHYHHS